MRTQLTYVGYILDSQPAEAREKFKREFLPTPLRLLWTVRGQRLYRAHRRAVYGTAA